MSRKNVGILIAKTYRVRRQCGFELLANQAERIGFAPETPIVIKDKAPYEVNFVWRLILKHLKVVRKNLNERQGHIT